jgi:hypothetical protein
MGLTISDPPAVDGDYFSIPGDLASQLGRWNYSYASSHACNCLLYPMDRSMLPAPHHRSLVRCGSER